MKLLCNSSPQDIVAELYAAGIPTTGHRIQVSSNGDRERSELPDGILLGWEFKRAWYYWIAESDVGIVGPVRGPGVVRARGMAGGYTVANDESIDLFHVDDAIGLDTLRQHIERYTQSS